MNDAGAAIPASDVLAALAVRAEATGSLAAICAGTRSSSLSIHSWKYLAAVLRVMESLRASSEMVASGASLRQAQTRLRLRAVCCDLGQVFFARAAIALRLAVK